MAIKLFANLIFIPLVFIKGNEAAKATCEFGPMEGVEGKNISFHIIVNFYY